MSESEAEPAPVEEPRDPRFGARIAAWWRRCAARVADRWRPWRLHMFRVSAYFALIAIAYYVRTEHWSDVISVLEARTEKITVAVDSQQLGALRLSCATWIGPGHGMSISGGVLHPPLGSEWTALALPGNRVFLRVAPVPNGSSLASLETLNSDALESLELPLPAVFEIDTLACPGRSSRLGIHGRVVIGEELKGPRLLRDRVLAHGPFLLLGGRVAFRLSLPTLTSHHYVQLENFELQPGARFAGGAEGQGEQGTRGSTWSGFVQPTAGGDLAVSISSSGRDFRIFSELGGQLEGESMGLDFVTLLRNDPLLLLLIAAIGAFETLYRAVHKLD
jgi:hypothetical protein